MPPTRRRFLKRAIASAGAVSLLPEAFARALPGDEAALPRIHVFSKHLQFLDYPEMAEVAADLGFDGVDLTVRPKGHVLPERVETDLPRAVDALKRAGFAPQMLTTAIDNPTDPITQRVLKTAAGLGFRYYRMNWFRYDEQQPVAESIRGFGQTLRALGELNRTLGLVGCYQNHAGLLVGASVWELWEMLQTADPQHMGVQYDIRHATVEGGLSWPNGLRLLQPRLKTLVLKDFRWEKQGGRWMVQNTPIGEGMVDFGRYFRLLKQYRIQVPVSLHFEYPLGGADQGDTRLTIDKRVVFDAMKRDLARVKQLWLSA